MFDKELAERACAFFPKYLHHTKGRWAGQPFELLPWQHDLISKLFGTLKEDGTRQYNWVYVEIPKKNGKSELAAGVALYLLFADREPGAEIYSAAADRDQAAIVFNVAQEMVQRSPALAAKCKLIPSTKRIVHKNGSFYRVLSADVRTKHGFNTHGVIFDELHAQPTRELWDVLTKGAGDARRQPVFFAITTAGYDRNSICWELHERARQALDGSRPDPTLLPVLYYAPEDADWRDEKVWEACNPSMTTLYEDGRGILEPQKLRDHCKLAIDNPAEENIFRRLRLCQWTKQESRFLPMHAWDACGEAFDAEMLRGKSCYAGLDLASTVDIAAFVLAFDVDGLIYLLPFFWIPGDNVEKRVNTDKVPYDAWIAQGLVKATMGNAIDYATIEHDIGELAGIYEVREIAFDQFNAVQLAQNLTDAGFTMVNMSQTCRSLNGGTKELLKLALSGNVRHGGNAVLRWMVDNVVVITDSSGYIKPDKARSSEKIDGVVAAVMALDRVTRQEPPSVYAERGILTLD